MNINEGLLYGYGLFESIKIEHNKPLLLQQHFARMQQAATALTIYFAYDFAQFHHLVTQEINQVALETFVLRCSLIKDKDKSYLVFSSRPFRYTKEMYQQGFKLTLSKIKRNEYSNLVAYKTLNYLDNLLELKKAKIQGFNEVLFLNTQEILTEGATSNLFLVKNNIIHTPSSTCGLLKGVMRQRVLDQCLALNLHTKEGCYDLNFILSCDEIFITNAVMGIMSVVRLNNHKYEDRHMANKLKLALNIMKK